MISRCPSCAAQVPDEADTCPSCRWDFAGFKHIPPAGAAVNPTLEPKESQPPASYPSAPGLPQARGRAEKPGSSSGAGAPGSTGPEFPTFEMRAPAAPPAPRAAAPATESGVPERLKRRSSMDRSVTKELKRRVSGADPMALLALAAVVVAAGAVVVVKITLRSDVQTGPPPSRSIFTGSSGMKDALPAPVIPAAAPAAAPERPVLVPQAPQAAARPQTPAAPAPPAREEWVFEGEIYDGMSLRPVPFGQLVFAGPDGVVAAEAVTRENGRYRVKLPAAPAPGYRVALKHPDYEPKFIDDIEPPVKTLSETERKAVLGASPAARPWRGDPKAAARKNVVAVPAAQP